MSRSVCYKSYKAFRFSQLLNYCFYNFQIALFVVTAYIIYFSLSAISYY